MAAATDRKLDAYDVYTIYRLMVALDPKRARIGSGTGSVSAMVCSAIQKLESERCEFMLDLYNSPILTNNPGARTVVTAALNSRLVVIETKPVPAAPTIVRCAATGAVLQDHMYSTHFDSISAKGTSVMVLCKGVADICTHLCYWANLPDWLDEACATCVSELSAEQRAKLVVGSLQLQALLLLFRQNKKLTELKQSFYRCQTLLFDAMCGSNKK